MIKRNEIMLSDKKKKSSPFYLETQQTNSSELMLHTVAFYRCYICLFFKLEKLHTTLCPDRKVQHYSHVWNRTVNRSSHASGRGKNEHICFTQLHMAVRNP